MWTFSITILFNDFHIHIHRFHLTNITQLADPKSIRNYVCNFIIWMKPKYHNILNFNILYRVFFYFLFGMVFDIFNSQPFLLVDLSHYLQRKWGTIIYQITIYIISARTSAVICWKYTDNKLAFWLIKCAEWLCKLNLIAPHLLRLMVNGYSKRLDQIKNKKNTLHSVKINYLICTQALH